MSQPEATSKKNQTKPDKNGQLSQKQHDAVLLILAGRSDAQVGEKLGVTRQTVNTWRNQDQAFRFELSAAARMCGARPGRNSRASP